MAYGPTLLQEVWDEVDNRMNEWRKLKNDPEPSTIEREYQIKTLVGRIRGYCWILAKYMAPHYPTEDAVLREALARQNARTAGEHHETKGLGTRRFEPPPGDNKLATKPITKAPALTLSVEECDKVRALGAADFPTDILAQRFNVPESQIKFILSNEYAHPYATEAV